MFYDTLLSDIPRAYRVLADLLTIAFITWGLGRLVVSLLAHLEKLAPEDTSHLKAWLQASGRPLQCGLWGYGLVFCLGLAMRAWRPDLSQHWHMQPLFHTIAMLTIAWIVSRYLAHVETQALHHRKHHHGLDIATVNTLCRLARFSIFTIAALISLQSLGVPLSGIVTFGGIGGIGVALAAKDLLANLFGGLMIFLDRPFSVGDWIRSPGAEIEGTVEHIGWRLTRIRTFDKRARYVPNALFSTLVIDNPSRMTHRRIKTSIGIRYQDNQVARSIVHRVEVMLREHAEIDSNQTLMVYFDELSDSSLNFFIYAFTKTTQWVKFHEILQDVLLKTLAIIEEHGAECAFPARSLYLVAGSDAHGMEEGQDSRDLMPPEPDQ